MSEAYDPGGVGSNGVAGYDVREEGGATPSTIGARP
jgi:hypothetical protein